MQNIRRTIVSQSFVIPNWSTLNDKWNDLHFKMFRSEEGCEYVLSSTYTYMNHWESERPPKFCENKRET